MAYYHKLINYIIIKWVFFFLILLNFSISQNNKIFKDYCKKKQFYINSCKKKKNKIIVSLTSWNKRIVNVYDVLKSILNQDTPPDLIELNLCEIEFPNKENDFPQKLLLLLKENEKIEINWVKKNTYTFKKIIPTIKKYFGKKYYLLSVDDDWIYRKDYISMMINYIEKFKSDSFCLGGGNVMGAIMIYKSTCFQRDFYEKLTDEIINLRIDDAYIGYYLSQKKKKMAFIKVENIFSIIKPFNSIFPNSDDGLKGRYIDENLRKANNLIHSIKFQIDCEKINLKKKSFFLEIFRIFNYFY